MRENIKEEQKYDMELFKQAYKAGLQAKEVESKERKKKRYARLLIYLCICFALISVIYLGIQLYTPKREYLQTGRYPSSSIFSDIEKENILFSTTDSFASDLEMSSKSIFVFNPLNGDVLYEKNSEERRYIASITKLMTAIVVLENFTLDEVITVELSNIPVDLDWQLGLKEGDRVSVVNLLKAMLISSYNDVPYILANAYPYGGYEGFVNAMNIKAQVLRMDNTHFMNPVGIDQEGSYSTAQDIGKLVSVSRRYIDILDIVSIVEETLNWSSNGDVVSKKILTTNQLYEVNRYIKGFKTGITDLAGQCFVGYFIYPNDMELVTIVLGSEDRFEDTILLEKYGRPLLK